MQRPRPPWAYISGDVNLGKLWYDELVAWRVDDKALKEFFALAQTDAHCRMECWNIFTKLWKKDIDGKMVSNSSAFVWNCVKNVRNERQLWG